LRKVRFASLRKELLRLENGRLFAGVSVATVRRVLAIARAVKPEIRVVKRSQRARTSLSGDNPTRSGAPRYHVSAPSLTRFGSSPARSPCNLLRS